jgi:Flp pilus assembly pilin Flp
MMRPDPVQDALKNLFLTLFSKHSRLSGKDDTNMPVKPISCSCYAQRGVTLAEYAVLLGLVLVMSIGGLKLLGGSISSLLGEASQKSANQGTIKLLGSSAQSTAVASGGTLGLKGSGYYGIKVNPTTGQPELTMINGASATNSNVSSIDGSRMNTLGSVMIASSLADLAAQQTDPELRSYYDKMAKLSYYLAGAEGELDEVPGLQLDILQGDKTYSKGNALADIVVYTSQLDGLMNNPPQTLSQTGYMQAMPLAADVYNIAHQYHNAFSRFVDEKGKVSQNFGVPQLSNNLRCCMTGDETPGSALRYANQATSNMPADLPPVGKMINAPYDRLVPYDQLRTVADGVLATNKVDNLPVASTIQNAQDLHGMASACSQTTSSTAITCNNDSSQ